MGMTLSQLKHFLLLTSDQSKSDQRIFIVKISSIEWTINQAGQLRRFPAHIVKAVIARVSISHFRLVVLINLKLISSYSDFQKLDKEMFHLFLVGLLHQRVTRSRPVERAAKIASGKSGRGLNPKPFYN
jgi:hypothetical protein